MRPVVRAFRGTQRRVVRFSGEDTFKFLQGMVCSDVSLLKGAPAEMRRRGRSLVGGSTGAGERQVEHAGVFSPRGRLVFDGFLCAGGDGGDVLMDVHQQLADRVVAYCRRFVLRNRVRMEVLPEDQVRIHAPCGRFPCWCFCPLVLAPRCHGISRFVLIFWIT